MKRIALYVSVGLVVIGLIGRLYAAQYSHVTAEGMLVDSAWLPIGTLLMVVGILALLVLGVIYAISYLRNRSRR